MSVICVKIQTAWNSELHKIYDVSEMTLDSVLVYIGCLPIKEELLFCRFKLLKQCPALTSGQSNLT